MNLRAILAAAAALVAVTVMTAPAASAAATDDRPISADGGYVLGPDDTIDVQVVGRQDFNAHVRIGADGSIQVPFLGTVRVAGRTAPQLGDDLAKALVAGGYFANPIMRVEIVGYASQYITVLGGVVNPGLVPIDRPYHVSDILARVGGTRETAADYVILRSHDGTEKRYLISELVTGGPAQDPLVWPGDKLFSPVADMFYVSGEVVTPGAYPLNSATTLRMAIGRGGGLTYRGTYRAIEVTRGGQRLRDVSLDSKIEPGDVIVVKERYF